MVAAGGVLSAVLATVLATVLGRVVDLGREFVVTAIFNELIGVDTIERMMGLSLVRPA
jgi:hypothetical protein